MRYRLRTLLIVAAIGPAVIAIFVALGQLHWYRSQVRYGGGLPSDPAVQTLEKDLKSRPVWDGKPPQDTY
jgi:hypothetical protein